MPAISHPGTNRNLFAHRSGLVIAIARTVMAALFALWVWIAPDQPARAHLAGYALLASYIALALILLQVTRRDWWLDFHLSRIAFYADCAIFLIAILFTQNNEGEFFSPYFAFFAFLMLSAVLRWNWASALIAGIALCLGFLLTSWLLSQGGVELEYQKLLRRTSYMAVVSLMVVWLAVRRGGVVMDLADLPDASSIELAPANALHWAMASAAASGALLAWHGTDEPRGMLHRAGTLGHGHDALPHNLKLDAAGDLAVLFDTARLRSLHCHDDGALTADKTAPPPLAALFAVPDGLYLPLRGSEGDGALILTGIPGLTQDDLVLGQAIAAEATRMLDRSKASHDARTAAAARVRISLARDLHDSVAQSLAGTGYRLAALRARMAAGEQPLAELDAIAANLRAEQSHLRQLIDGLRHEPPLRTSADLSVELAELVPALGRQWGIAAVLAVPPGQFPIQPARLFDCLQIVREAVANAVRHGRAGQISVGLTDHGTVWELTIADDGQGFPADQPPAPRSIAERAATMLARLAIESQPGRTVLAITLPAGERA